MKLQLCFCVYKIALEIKKMIKYNDGGLLKDDKIIVYNSDIFGKMQLSTEVLYQLLSIEDDTKYFPLIVMEMIKIGWKFKEMGQLQRMGYFGYIDKEIYYEQMLGICEEDVLKKFTIDSNKINSFLTIKPKRSNVFVPIRKDLKIVIPSQLIKYGSEEINEMNDNKKAQFKILSMLSLKSIEEFLYIIRPGIYLSLLVAFKNTPYVSLIASAIIDGIILLLQSRDNNRLTFTHKKAFYYERKYRLMKLFIYLLREPIYTKITLKVIVKVFDCLYFPQFIQRFVYDLLSYYRNIYFIA